MESIQKFKKELKKLKIKFQSPSQECSNKNSIFIDYTKDIKIINIIYTMLLNNKYDNLCIVKVISLLDDSTYLEICDDSNHSVWKCTDQGHRYLSVCQHHTEEGSNYSDFEILEDRFNLCGLPLDVRKAIYREVKFKKLLD